MPTMPQTLDDGAGANSLNAFLSNQAKYAENAWYGYAEVLAKATYCTWIENGVMQIIVELPGSNLELTDKMIDSISKNIRRHFATMATYREIMQQIPVAKAHIYFQNSES